jgi:hypothetical protein
LHFEGMYQYLVLRDPEWKIISLRALYPYRP